MERVHLVVLISGSLPASQIASKATVKRDPHTHFHCMTGAVRFHCGACRIGMREHTQFIGYRSDTVAGVWLAAWKKGAAS